MNETLNTIMNTPFNVIVNEAIHILNNLHFIRGDWFYAFIPLMLYLIFSSNKTQSDKNWQSVIDKNLLPFVLTQSDNKRRSYPLLLIFIAGSLCITALAGPVYKKLPQPVYREQSSLVVLLDLSQSMNATDIKPSRLSRAKLELLDILKTRKTGQTALIVYAADAFVVTPLTDDNANIANLVPALETDMMPAQGSNLSTALAKTISLFTQSGIIKGDILIITDDIHQRHKEAIKKVHSQGFRLSIFGIGTTEGGPIPLHGSLDGGFLQDSNGAIVIPKLHASKLQTYALSASGLYTGLQADDSDTNKLSRLFQSSEVYENTNNQNTNADIWQEEGHWLLLPLLFFAALWARKGWIAVFLPFAIIFTFAIPQPVYAESTEALSNKTEPAYLDIKHLWSSPDQKAMKAFNAGDNENAASLFTRAEWKASAYYRSRDYESAVKALESTSNSNGYYNKANALAKLGQYQDAIKAYDSALELNENNEDARYNREQVKQALKKQQENSEQNKEQDNSEQEENQQDSEDQNSENQDKENQDSKDQQKQQQDDQAGDLSSEENKQADQNEPAESSKENQERQQDKEQQAEEKQLKQRDAEAEAKKEQQEKQQYEQDKEETEDKDNQSQQETENKEIENKEGQEKPAEIEVNPMEASITEEEKATEQWLKRIPDDPGGLLRRKFLYQYKQIPNQNDENEPW